MIATPFYGGITRSVFLYGNVKLVYAYLDSKVRIERREYMYQPLQSKNNWHRKSVKLWGPQDKARQQPVGVFPFIVGKLDM